MVATYAFYLSTFLILGEAVTHTCAYEISESLVVYLCIFKCTWPWAPRLVGTYSTYVAKWSLDVYS